MKRTNFFILGLALVITFLTTVIQHRIAPIYPLKGSFVLEGERIDFKFIRSHGGPEDHLVELDLHDQIDKLDLSKLSAVLWFKKYNFEKDWTKKIMKLNEGKLNAYLPKGPPAAKLEYFVQLHYDGNIIDIPGDRACVIRFRGSVKWYYLVRHVFVMLLTVIF